MKKLLFLFALIAFSVQAQKTEFTYTVGGDTIKAVYHHPTTNSDITFPSGRNTLAAQSQVNLKLDSQPVSDSTHYYGGDRVLHKLPEAAETTPFADTVTPGKMRLYVVEGSGVDGTINQKTVSEALQALRTSLAAIPGISGLTSEKLLNQIELIKTGVDYGFNDYVLYTKTNCTISVGTTKGIKIQGTSAINPAFISTGKIITPNVYSVTLTGKLTAGPNAYFGFAIKNGTSYTGGQYNANLGNFSNNNFGSSATQTGSTLSLQPTYAIGDIVSVRMIFRGGSTVFQTAKNGVWSAETPATATHLGTHGGEIVIDTRTSCTYDDVTVKVEDLGDFAANVYVATTGSDLNDGSLDYPLATISEAKQRTKGIGTINLKGGDYFDQRDVNLSSKIVGERGTFVRLISGTRFNSATLEPGYTKVYSVPYAPTLTSANVLWQHDVKDPASLILQSESHPLHRGYAYRLGSMKMTWQPSLAALEASSTTRAYFFWSAGTLYFTITAGSNLTTNPVVIPSSVTATISSEATNIEFLYYNGVSCSGQFIATECSSLYGDGIYGFGYGSAVGGTFRRCRAGGTFYSGGGDGFNSTTGAVVSLAKRSSVISYDCWSHDNGDDGDSLHNNAECSIFGGLYEYNIGSGITAASGGHMGLYNATIRRNTGVGIGVTGSAADGGTGTNVYANSCIVANNAGNAQGNTASWASCTLVNCVSVGGSFSGTSGKYNCVDIP